MKNVLLLMFLVFCLFFTGCEQIKSFMSDEKNAEKAMQVLAAAEDFHAKAKVSIATYFVENPGKLSVDQIAQLKAANEAFEIAYKTTKKAIADIKYAKQGGNITLSDISSELLIFAGKYAEFKKAIQPLIQGRVTFPDEEVLNKNITPESLVNANDAK